MFCIFSFGVLFNYVLGGLLYWVFVGFLCEKNKVGWIGRGRDLEKLWGGKEYDQIYLKVALNLKKITKGVL